MAGLNFLTDDDVAILKTLLKQANINPGSQGQYEPAPAIHRASDVVVVKVTSTIAKRVGSTVNSATCEVWKVSTWATAGYSIPVHNISDSADVVGTVGTPVYYTAVIDREGEWHFAGAVSGITAVSMTVVSDLSWGTNGSGDDVLTAVKRNVKVIENTSSAGSPEVLTLYCS